MKMSKALLVVEPTKNAFNRFASILKRPSKTKYKGYTVLSFPSFETLGKVITGTRLELLSAIKTRSQSRFKSCLELWIETLRMFIMM